MEIYQNGAWNEVVPALKFTTMVGATASANGTGGAVPAPSAGSDTKFLRGDGTWQKVATDDYLPITGGTVTGDLTVTGTITAEAVYNAVYNDYAEFFERGEETETGQIIGLLADGKTYGKATKDTVIVAGVQSGEFAQIIGGDKAPKGRDFVEYNLPNFIPVALAGRVHCKVKGDVAIGDYIVPSETAGVGIASKEWTDKSVGRALENAEGPEVRMIRILVGR